MHYTQSLAALVALSSVTFATPVSFKPRQSKYSVTQVLSSKKVAVSGPIAYKQALEKFSATVPSFVMDAAASAESGTATAAAQKYDSEYLTPITVGGQKLVMDFDTGSSDLWVFSTQTPANEAAGHTTYDPSKSDTSKLLSGETWKIQYGDGSSASGIVYADTVDIGGVTATSQAVEAATAVSGAFKTNKAQDGLVGLAFSKINTCTPTKQQTFFANVMDSLAEPLFAVTLKHAAPGTFDFGFIDHSRYTGSLVYTPVSSENGFWQFSAQGYTIGSTSRATSLSCIADTGTSLIMIEDSVVQAYWSQVQGASMNEQQGGYVFPCSATLPTFGLTVQGTTFRIPGSYMNFAPIGGGSCYGGIQSSAGLGFNVIGDVWLKGQYVVFDGSKPQLGIASQTGSTVANGTNGTSIEFHRPNLRSTKLW